MMKCINETCSSEAAGRSKYCSDACKVAFNRNKKRPATVTNETVTPNRNTTRTASYQDYIDNLQDYAQRADAGRLNWGERMDQEQLKAAGLKANRISIPGDWDYVGCCVNIDGVA